MNMDNELKNKAKAYYFIIDKANRRYFYTRKNDKFIKRSNIDKNIIKEEKGKSKGKQNKEPQTQPKKKHNPVKDNETTKKYKEDAKKYFYRILNNKRHFYLWEDEQVFNAVAKYNINKNIIEFIKKINEDEYKIIKEKSDTIKSERFAEESRKRQEENDREFEETLNKQRQKDEEDRKKAYEERAKQNDAKEQQNKNFWEEFDRIKKENERKTKEANDFKRRQEEFWNRFYANFFGANYRVPPQIPISQPQDLTLKKFNINTRADWLKWLNKYHPDKSKEYPLDTIQSITAEGRAKGW